MKKYLFLVVAIVVAVCTSCKQEPKIKHLAGCDGIVIETKEGRLYGMERDGVIRLRPEWDNIIYGNLDGHIYQAWKGDNAILFDYWGRTLCDSIPLVGRDKKKIVYSANTPGTGIPQNAARNFALAHTEKGVFALFFDEDITDWYQYGPFADFCGGATGYMFKDNTTGKWGAAKYGSWTENENSSTTWDKWKFSYERSAVVLQPQYEQIISVSYKKEGSEADPRGYSQESDIKWYAFDGTKWNAFDFSGQPLKMNKSEQTKLTKLRKLNPRLGKATRNDAGEYDTQRIGTEEASWVITK